MGKLTALLCIAFGLAGCASGPAPTAYGHFVQVPVAANDKVMADDVANKLGTLYPPARTSIKLRQATPDAFGITLVTALRTKGYALAEFDPAQRTGTPAGTAGGMSATGGDLALAYVVDQPLDAGIYRVTVVLNSQSLSRVYKAKDGGIAPAGYWVRKE